ncbi:UNVERIFIED_CONTAM: hypothetical protein NCL1_12974 [Trichonephila clavipes]
MSNDILNKFIPMHYEEFFRNFLYEFSLLHGPRDLNAARKRCKNLRMELFKPYSWDEISVT